MNISEVLIIFILSFILFIIIPAFHCIYTRNTNKHIISFPIIIGLSIITIIWVLVFHFTPTTYFVQIIKLSHISILIISTLIYTFIYMEIISQVFYGFSIDIVVNTYNKKIINIEDIKKYVGTGNGLKWLVLNRINNLEKLNCITIINDKITLTRKGRIICSFINFLQRAKIV